MWRSEGDDGRIQMVLVTTCCAFFAIADFYRFNEEALVSEEYLHLKI